MYYVEVARAPLADRTVMFLALLAASCGGDLNPIRARPPVSGRDAAGRFATRRSRRTAPTS